MKLLLHTCCAPCSIYCIKTLREKNIEPTVYWYNPNIHPYTEYIARKKALEIYTKSININAIYEDYYGLREFTKNVINNLENRCSYCYKTRLEKTVQYAKENGYNSFSTTLLISPYQNHEKLKNICKELEQEYAIEFIYRDFRTGFREGQTKARQLELYMQKYCGCIFSEEERFLSHTKDNLTATKTSSDNNK